MDCVACIHSIAMRFQVLSKIIDWKPMIVSETMEVELYDFVNDEISLNQWLNCVFHEGFQRPIFRVHWSMIQTDNSTVMLSKYMLKVAFCTISMWLPLCIIFWSIYECSLIYSIQIIIQILDFFLQDSCLSFKQV